MYKYTTRIFEILSTRKSIQCLTIRFYRWVIFLYKCQILVYK